MCPNFPEIAHENEEISLQMRGRPLGPSRLYPPMTAHLSTNTELVTADSSAMCNQLLCSSYLRHKCVALR